VSKLNTRRNFRDPDDFYARLMDLHEGHSKVESEPINTRLILLLANHIGDGEVLDEAFRLAAASHKPAATG